MWRVIWFFLGVSRLSITGASPEWCMQRLAKARIAFHFCAKPDDFTAEVWILRRDEARAAQLVRMGGCDCAVIERGGFSTVFGGLRKRPALLILLAAAIAAGIVVPKYVFFYEVEGNEAVPSAQILRELGVKSLRLLTNNPDKVYQLSEFGLEISERVPIQMAATAHDLFYLKTKQARMGHILEY